CFNLSRFGSANSGCVEPQRLRWSVGHDPPRMGVMASPDIPVGGPTREVGQPHHLNVAPSLALKPAARLNPIEIAVDLQHAVSGSVWMTGSTRTIPLRASSRVRALNDPLAGQLRPSACWHCWRCSARSSGARCQRLILKSLMG